MNQALCDEKTLRAYYARRAQEYDLIYEKPERQGDLRLLEAFVSGQFSNKHVLEIACGTGYWTQFYASKALSVTAIDSAKETLDIAKSRIIDGTVDFKIADAYALPNDLGSFDAALACFWLSHVPKKWLKTFLEGLHHRLEDGALVLLIDNLYVEGSSTPILSQDEDGNTFQLRTLCNGTTHKVLKNFLSPDDLTFIIKGLGIEHKYIAFKYYYGFSYRVIK